MNNIATDTKSTNVFETLTGMLPIAPLKISGQYKFVVDLSGKIWLDDYNERRVELDLTKRILPQVAKFLKIKTEIVHNDFARYGGFQRLTQKYWHIPLYLNVEKYNNDSYSKDTLPRFYVLSRVVNETITDPSYLQKYGLMLQLYDLQKLKITGIIEEILRECPDYPVYHNFEANQLSINGYSITEECWKTVTLNTVYQQANQPYLDTFNNDILNAFQSNNLFFPRFLNFEFEFEYNDEFTPFNNFWGYFTKSKELTLDEVNEIPGTDLGDRNLSIFVANVADYDSYIVWKQEKYKEKIALQKYLVPIENLSTIPVQTQQPQVRFGVNNISINDEIAILDEDSDIYFSYVIQESDIIPTSLYQTLIYICKRMTKKCGYEFEFTVDRNNIVTCKSNMGTSTAELYSVKLPPAFEIQDRFSKSDSTYEQFRGITSFDLCLANPLSFDVDAYYMRIGDIHFEIVDYFKFNGKNFIRCVGENGEAPIIDESHVLTFSEIRETKLYTLEPVAYLTFLSNLKALPQFDANLYANNLLEKFRVEDEAALTDDERLKYELFKQSVEKFRTTANRNQLADTLPYTKDDEVSKEIVPYNIIEQENHDDEIVKTILFDSFGSGSCLVPTVLNIDKHFTVKNGNVNFNNLDLSAYAFHWFLIKGECPDYMLNDFRSIRYFTDVPKLTSRIMRVNTYYCETMFLGVKYRFPLEYEDWQFAVYLDPNNQLDVDTNYRFIIDRRNHRLYLKIGAYIDFNDLIRAGNSSNEPLIDLSLMYGVESSYNETSDFISGFTEARFLLCDTSIPVIDIAGNLTTDWRCYNEAGEMLMSLKSSDPELNMESYFTGGTKQEFLLWSDIVFEGQKYSYISAKINVKGIEKIRDNVVWCKDIQCKFFDTEEMFVQQYHRDGKERIQDFFRVNREKSVTVLSDDAVNTPGNPTQYMYGDNAKQCEVIVTRPFGSTKERMRLMLPDKVFSLREDYFEMTKEIIGPEPNGSYSERHTLFFFPNCIVGYENEETQTNPEIRGFKHPDMNWDEFVAKFGNESFDTTSKSSTIHLFMRNQIWLFIRDYISNDVRFKSVSKEQVRNNMNKMLVSNLKDFTDYKSVPVEVQDGVTAKNNEFGFVTIKVLDHDYNSIIWNILTPSGYVKKIVSVSRYKSPYLPFIPIVDSMIEFQREKYVASNHLFNIYDENFGGAGISATGMWKEVDGNVVSSLFCKRQDYTIAIPFSQEINVRDLLTSQIQLDNCLINNNRNEEYISKIDENIDKYIIETFVDYLLKNFYTFADVRNELGQVMSYTTDKKNPDVIRLGSRNSYGVAFRTLYIRFTRK